VAWVESGADWVGLGAAVSGSFVGAIELGGIDVTGCEKEGFPAGSGDNVGVAENEHEADRTAARTIGTVNSAAVC
jgi:hypothetical protein